jgi:hypothetical protein
MFDVDRMNAGREVREKLLEILRPYGSPWSGAIARGDLVIPQREIPKLVREIAEAFQTGPGQQEADERTIFEALMDVRRTQSVQKQAAALVKRFRIFVRGE